MSFPDRAIYSEAERVLRRGLDKRGDAPNPNEDYKPWI